MYVTLEELIGHEHYKDNLKILIKFPSRLLLGLDGLRLVRAPCDFISSENVKLAI